MTNYVRLCDRLERIALAVVDNPQLITDWEANFLRGLEGKMWGSWKQLEILERIEGKVASTDKTPQAV